MAKITPYGDPSAHGKINSSIQFRRYRGIVSLQTTPRRTISTSPAIIEQRQKLKNAVRAWSLEPFSVRVWYNKRGSTKGLSGRSYYIKAHMQHFTASQDEQNQVKAITAFNIYDPLAESDTGILFELFGEEPAAAFWSKLGSDGDVEAPLIGPAGVITGEPNYVYSKWGKGITGIDTDNRVTWAGANTVINDGIIDFHWTPSFGWERTTNAQILTYFFDTSRFLLIFIGSVNLIELTIQSNGGPWQPRYRFYPQNFEADDKIRITVILNPSATSGNRVKLYMNKIRCINQNVANEVPWDYPDFPLMIGSPGTPHYDFIMDNIILYHDSSREEEILAHDKEAPPTETQKYGEIFDKERIWYPDKTLIAPQSAFIDISNINVIGLKIPHYWQIGIEWIDTNDEIRHSTIRFGELKIDSLETVRLYFAHDWSLYYDKNLRLLAGTARN